MFEGGYIFFYEKHYFFILNWVKVNRTQEVLSASWAAETAHTEEKDSISAT